LVSLVAQSPVEAGQDDANERDRRKATPVGKTTRTSEIVASIISWQVIAAPESFSTFAVQSSQKNLPSWTKLQTELGCSG
jgi:hypothetical protein